MKTFFLQLYHRKSKIFWLVTLFFFTIGGWSIYLAIDVWIPKLIHDILSRTPYVNDNFTIYIKLSEVQISFQEKAFNNKILSDEVKLAQIRQKYIGTPVYHFSEKLRILGFTSWIEKDGDAYRFYLSISQNYHPQRPRNDPQDQSPRLDYTTTEFVFMDNSQSSLIPIMQQIFNESETEKLKNQLQTLQKNNRGRVENIWVICWQRLESRFQKQQVWQNLKNDAMLKEKIVQAMKRQLADIPWQYFWEELQKNPDIQVLADYLQVKFNLGGLGKEVFETAMEQTYQELLNRKTTPDSDTIFKKFLLAWNYVAHRDELERKVQENLKKTAAEALRQKAASDGMAIIADPQIGKAATAVITTLTQHNLPQLIAAKAKRVFEDSELCEYIEREYGSDADAIRHELMQISQDQKVHHEFSYILQDLQASMSEFLKKIILNQTGTGPNPFLARLVREILFSNAQNGKQSSESQIICFVNTKTQLSSSSASTKKLSRRPYRVVSFEKAFQSQK